MESNSTSYTSTAERKRAELEKPALVWQTTRLCFGELLQRHVVCRCGAAFARKVLGFQQQREEGEVVGDFLITPL